MTIQGIEIPDDLIAHAYGDWKRDTHCVIVIHVEGGSAVPFIGRTSEEINQMHGLLNHAVATAHKNRSQG